jgi:hypothetical protein
MSVHIAYPSSGVTWSWQAGLHQWVRSYPPNGPAELGEGGQITAANIIIMKMVLYPSPYVEDPTGAHENILVLTGSGPAQVFRDGDTVSGTWDRSALRERTEYLDSVGHAMALSPGSTWVELVPTTVTVTVAP